MPLFPSRYGMASSTTTAPKAGFVPQQAPRRQGMFGRLGGWLGSRDWEGIGAAMRDDPAILSGLQDHRLRRTMFGEEVRGQKIEQGAAAAEQQNLESAIATLSPAEQALARLNPEAFAASRLGAERYGPLETIDGRLGQPNLNTGQYDWAPQVPREGSGRTQYRPVTPDEVQTYNLPGNGAGFVMGDNGRPIRVGGGGTFSADQRARVEIGIEPALESVRILDQIEGATGQDGAPIEGAVRRSPRNSQWGASLLDSLDGNTTNTGALARNWGGAEFQRYTSAGSSFESAMLPILSGAAVTPSEAERLVRAALPQLGDGPQLLADKARRRQQMLNGAAAIGGREPPFPEAGVPEWAANYQRALDNASAGEEDAPPEGFTQEEWDLATPEERALFQ